MSKPDFARAQEYALGRLARELPPNVFYHSLPHTRDDVLPAAERLAALAGVNADDLLLLRTSALYHDIGFVERRAGHEDAGARIVAEVLPEFGYTAGQVTSIRGMILATKLPQSPRTWLEEITADSDLDVLGRQDYMSRGEALRAELATIGAVMTTEQWFQNQLQFIEGHRYFTAVARALRDGQKHKNIALVRSLLNHTPR